MPKNTSSPGPEDTTADADGAVTTAGAASGGASPDALLDDDWLVTQAAAGDRAAWGALVDRHLGPICGYAWRMLGDRSEAEDIAQETFMRLMAKLPEWEPGGARLGTWLYRVAINLCIDRSRKRVPETVAELPEVPDAHAARAEANFDRARIVQAALDRLPERQKTVLTLIYYQGLSNGEVAELLKLSVEAVESLLSRARRALRASLAPVRDDLLGGT